MNKHLLSFSLLLILAYSASAQYWKLKGNSDATSSSFLGTINSQPLRFYTENKQRMQIDDDGRVIVGSSNSSSPSAIFEVTSVNHGVLLPRMTESQRKAISSPAQGLLVYQKDGTRGVYYYEGGWKTFTSGGGSGFANTALSNLTTTAVNQSLLPNSDNSKNLGSSSKGWKDLYLQGRVYLGGQRFLSGPGDNTFTGRSAGLSNTGGGNTANGYQALFSNTSGGVNTAFGSQALYSNAGASANTAVGYQALFSNSTGIGNTALGFQASYSNISASSNTAIGTQALYTDTDGDGNTAIGPQALYTNNGFYNIAVGSQSLTSNTTGGSNTSLGFQTLFYNTAGYGNTAIGRGALQANSTNNYNTGVGYFPGDGASTYSNATFLGASATTVDGLTNVTAVGYGATTTADNTVELGNSSVVSVMSSGTFVTASDGRFKRDIKEEVPGLEFINKLRPVTYHYNIHDLNTHVRQDSKVLQKAGEGLKGLKGTQTIQEAEGLKGVEAPKINEQAEAARKQKDEESIKAKEAIKYTGFIAQEVEDAAKKVKYDFSGVHKPTGSKDVYGLSYAEFVVPLVKAVQELSKKADKVDELEKKVAALEELVTKMSKGQGISNASNTSLSLSSAYLEQSAPNPSDGIAVVRYYIPENAGSAKLIFTNIKGSIIKSVNVSRGKGQVTLNNNAMAAGSYTYTLYVDNALADSRQMIISR